MGSRGLVCPADADRHVKDLFKQVGASFSTPDVNLRVSIGNHHEVGRLVVNRRDHILHLLRSTAVEAASQAENRRHFLDAGLIVRGKSGQVLVLLLWKRAAVVAGHVGNQFEVMPANNVRSQFESVRGSQFVSSTSPLDIFDWRFKKYLTPWILRVSWLIVLLVAALWVLLAIVQFCVCMAAGNGLEYRGGK